jgi:hypothetical protein
MPVFCLVHPTLSFSMALETADLAAVFTLVMAAAVFFAAAEPVSLATWDTIQFVLFDMQSRTLEPYLTTMNRILIAVMKECNTKSQKTVRPHTRPASMPRQAMQC